MSSLEKIQFINQVIRQYFDLHPRETRVPAKDLMPYFVKAGIFPSDHKNGLPIRNLLRQLDNAKELRQIPYAHPERKLANANWFFVRRSSASQFKPAENTQLSKTSTRDKPNKVLPRQRDELYVLELCDSILNEKSLRQHRFDFLRGDAGTRLPVDAFYPKLNVVIEYRERQHTEPVRHFDKPDIMTVSGVARGKQRKLYDQRRRDVLKKEKIKLIEIPYSIFNCTASKRIIRSGQDKEKLQTFLRTKM